MDRDPLKPPQKGEVRKAFYIYYVPPFKENDRGIRFSLNRTEVKGKNRKVSNFKRCFSLCYGQEDVKPKRNNLLEF